MKWLLPLHQMKKMMLHPKKKSRTRKRKREIRDLITLLHITMVICLTLTPSLRYPLVTPPQFDRTDYTKWSYSMRMHLISLSLSVWNIMCVGVDFPNKDEEPDFEQLQ
jgi:hypothetical protein